MTPETALSIYESMSRPPKEALRQIEAGKLKNKTDINPQWRYKIMTEKFGLAGIGWKYEIRKLWTEHGSGQEILAFAQVDVYIKDGDTWSDPITGIGGSKLVNTEKGSLVSNDEGYKMAVTDAFSTALKMIGVAADIYAGKWNGSKYIDSQSQQRPPQQNQQRPQNPQNQKVLDLGKRISDFLKLEFTNGNPVFTKEEVDEWRAASNDKFKAKDADGLEEIFEQLKQVVGSRINRPAPENEQPDLQEQAQIVANAFDGPVF